MDKQAACVSLHATAICRKTNLNGYISNDQAQHAQETGPPPREAEKSGADARCNALRARHKTRIARTRILSPPWHVWLRLTVTTNGASGWEGEVATTVRGISWR